ncbi:MAG: hypothetical protein HYX38_15555 [Rhodospirillales bacterium]|nr:hypothetical protein [Rhodospirillales bacterium]
MQSNGEVERGPTLGRAPGVERRVPATGIHRRSQCLAARLLGANAVRGKDGKEPVTQELQHLAAPFRDGVADAFEMLVEPADDVRARVGVDERGEAAKIGEEQRRRDDLAVAAPDHPLHHVGPGLRTEVGPQRFDRNARQPDSIGDNAERREDTTDCRDFVLGEAAGAIGRHGERRAAKRGATLAEPDETKGILGHAQSAQILEQREPPHDLRILEIPAFLDQVALDQIENRTALKFRAVAILGREGVARQSLVA